jgi:dipeptidyl aminopeptidase/acylaminoacyl peptidase
MLREPGHRPGLLGLPLSAVAVTLVAASLVACGSSPPADTIAFVGQDRRGAVDVYSVRADGSNLRRLTWAGGDAPTWSPDGARIAFVSDRDFTFEFPQTYVMRRDGKAQHLFHRGFAGPVRWTRAGLFLTGTLDGKGREGEFLVPATGEPRRVKSRADYGVRSPEGSRVLSRVGDRGTRIIETDRYGRHAARLTNDVSADPARTLYEDNPSWSPDGRRIALTSNRYGGNELVVVRADGTHPRRVAPGIAVSSPATWSPDGRTLAFAGAARFSGDALWRVGVDGLGLRKVVQRPIVWMSAPAWEPGKRPTPGPPPRPAPVAPRVVFRTPFHYDFGRLTHVRRVLATTTFGVSPEEVSPDGRLLAYVVRGVGVIDLSTGSSRLLAFRRYLGTSADPHFSEDGRTLLFRDGNRIRMVPVAGGQARTIARVADTGPAQWLADGRLAWFDRRRRLVVGGHRTALRIPNPAGADDLLAAAAISSDGTRVLFSRHCDLWLDDGRLRKVGAGLAASPRSWAPNGRYFVVRSDSWDESCRTVDPSSPGLLRLYSAAGRLVGYLPHGSFRWTPDSRRLLIAFGDGRAAQLDLVTRRVTTVLRRHPAVSDLVPAGGRKIVFVRAVCLWCGHDGKYAEPAILETGELP